MLSSDCVINNDLLINDGIFKTYGNYLRIDNDVSIGSEGRLDSDSGLIIVTGDWENLRGSHYSSWPEYGNQYS